MKITREQIAKVGMVSVDVVTKAVQRGNLNLEDLESVLGFVLLGRVKALGIGFLDGLPAPSTVYAPEAPTEKTDQEWMDELGYVPVMETKPDDPKGVGDAFEGMDVGFSQESGSFSASDLKPPALKVLSSEEIVANLSKMRKKGVDF